MAGDRGEASALQQSLQQALGALEPGELAIFTLGVLHGVPVRQLPEEKGWTCEQYQETLIGALKKVRRGLAEAGCTTDAVLKALPAPRGK